MHARPKPKRQKYRAGRRICAFCGNPGASHEHIFPKWLKEYFPRDESSTHTFGAIRWPAGLITKSPILHQRKRQWHSGTVHVRVVCERCNNDWMSQLEERTKHLIIPLLICNRTNLGLEAQTALATWASKTTMIAEYVMNKETNKITHRERKYVMENLTPPAELVCMDCRVR